jgi:hypothetical protein
MAFGRISGAHSAGRRPAERSSAACGCARLADFGFVPGRESQFFGAGEFQMLRARSYAIASRRRGRPKRGVPVSGALANGVGTREAPACLRCAPPCRFSGSSPNALSYILTALCPTAKSRKGRRGPQFGMSVLPFNWLLQYADRFGISRTNSRTAYANFAWPSLRRCRRIRLTAICKSYPPQRSPR